MRLTTVLVAISLTTALAAPAAALQSASPSATTSAPAASEWPQKATVDGKTYVLNAPSYTGISGNTVTMRSAVQVSTGKGNPVDGTIEMTAVISQSSAPGFVELGTFSVTACTMSDGSGSAMTSAIAGLLDGMAIEATLPTIVQGIAIDSSRDVSGLANPVPAIRVVERAAVLVTLTGDPVLGDCGAGWKRVVNTPSILLKSPDGTWYSRVGGTSWLSAATITGPFTATDTTPPDEVMVAVHSVSGPRAASASAANRSMPDVIVATSPTVLVSINGAPKLAAACDGVERVTNASMPVLRTNGTWWLLASGRWYSAPSLKDGPWTYVDASSVPSSFSSLPADGMLAAVRASVPGTVEAKSAAVASSIVRAVTVQRSGMPCKVRFTGTPAFAPINGDLSFATNASQPVIQSGSTFYCCDDGAWFTATSSSGPWSVCDSVPASIYSIPASSPVYACTFVEVVASTPTTVTFGSTAGYLGTYMQGGVPVFGTGYDYNASTVPAIDQAKLGSTSYVAPSYPTTFGNQSEYSYSSGTYAPEQDDGWSYGYADLYPSIYANGYGGWGWSPYWGTAWGYGCGWGCGWGWGCGAWGDRGWGAWSRGWHDRGMADRALNNRGDGRAANAAQNRWNNARGANVGNRDGARNGSMANRGMDGYHRAGGSESVSGFRSAEGSRYGGYSRSGGGMRGGRR